MQGNFIVLPEKEYNEMKSLIEEVRNKLSQMSESTDSKQIGRWIPEEEAQKRLGKGTTTLWSMRRKGILEWTKINNRVYYSVDSILELLERNSQQVLKYS